MKCTLQNCDGEYEHGTISQSFRVGGRIAVVDGIPAEVCPRCGDVLLTPETSRRIAELVRGTAEPSATAPVFMFATG